MFIEVSEYEDPNNPPAAPRVRPFALMLAAIERVDPHLSGQGYDTEKPGALIHLLSGRKVRVQDSYSAVMLQIRRVRDGNP